MTSATHRPVAPLGAAAGVHPDRLDWAPDGAPVPPPSCATIGAALLDAAQHDPHRVAYYLLDDCDRITRLSAGDVLDRAAGAAQVAREAGVKRGDAVILAMDTGPDLLAAFYGCVLLDAVPVIAEAAIATRRAAAWADRIRYLASAAGSRHLVVHEAAAARAAAVCPGIRVLTAPFPIAADTGHAPAAGPADLALVQFTSGTTARAKGVAVTHAALVANVRALGQASGVRRGDLVLGWLPLFHDMGLVGIALGPALHGLPAAILPPLSFIFRPERWLWAIHHLRGTVSAAPNFAYQLCLTRIGGEALAGLDLSSWRLAFNGAEHVQAATIAQWQERMGRYGFRPSAMFPVYGLAEAALAVTAPGLGAAPVVDVISRAELARAGHADPAGGASDALDVVGVGRPLPGYCVRVVGPDGLDLPPRRQGQIVVTGPSVTSGYVGQPGGACPVRDGWLHTGDLGYLADGQLFVTGRDKEVLIRAGRNYHPHDIEAAAATVSGVRRRGVIAAGLRDTGAGTESITLAAETPIREPERLRALRRSVEDAVLRQAGIRPDAVIFVKPGTLPRTTSGKLKRAMVAEMIAAGTLPARPVTPAHGTPPPGQAPEVPS